MEQQHKLVGQDQVTYLGAFIQVSQMLNELLHMAFERIIFRSQRSRPHPEPSSLPHHLATNEQGSASLFRVHLLWWGKKLAFSKEPSDLILVTGHTFRLPRTEVRVLAV